MASSGYPESPWWSNPGGNPQSNYSNQGRGRGRNYQSSYSDQWSNPGGNPQSNYSNQGRGRSRNFQSPDDNQERGRGRSSHYPDNELRGYGGNYQSPFSDQGRGRGRNYQSSYSDQSNSRGRTYPYPDPNQYRQDQNYSSREEKMDDISISRGLSNILRHSADKLKLQMDSRGYIFVNDILKLNRFFLVTPEDIKRVVKENNKQRFSLMAEESTGKLKIRANQGHSLKLENLDLDFHPITDPVSFPVVLHGTYTQSWPSIKKEGLKKMKRAYIHFAAGMPGQNGVISGMRSSCEILIYIDLEKALKDGLEFFLSTNKVILCKGNENGIIAPKYFSKVVDWYTGKVIFGEDKNPKKHIPIGMADPDKKQTEDFDRKSKKSKKDHKGKKSIAKETGNQQNEKMPKEIVPIDADSDDSESKNKNQEWIQPGYVGENSTGSTDKSHREEDDMDSASYSVPENSEDNISKNVSIKKSKKQGKKSTDSESCNAKEKVVSEENIENNESAKKKKKKGGKISQNDNAEKSSPDIVIVEDIKTKQGKSLKKEPVIGVHALKQDINIIYILITVPGTVFVFDPTHTKDFLKILLENNECLKVIYDCNLIFEMFKQFEIVMYRTPIADIQVLFNFKKPKNIARSLVEIVGNVCGKIPVPVANVQFEKMAEKLQTTCKPLNKTLSSVSGLINVYEEHKSLMEDAETAIFEKYDKCFDDDTKAKLNSLN